MALSPLAAGCIAAVVCGTAAVTFAALRTQKQLLVRGTEIQRGFVAAGGRTEAELRALAARWVRELEEVGQVKITGAATTEAYRTVQQDFGITPQFVADIASVGRQLQAARDNPWATAYARLRGQ